MKKGKIFIVTTTIFGLMFYLCTIAGAGDLNPPAAPTSGTMKTLDEVESRVVLNAVNTPGTTAYVYRITQPGSYILTNNILVNTDDGGILIDADNVTLDLQGHLIENTYTSTKNYHGIYLNSTRKNVTVQNGSIKGFSRGVYSSTYNSSSIRIFHIRALNNTSSGIYIYSFSSDTYSGGGCLIQACMTENNGYYGIYCSGGGIVMDCVSARNAYVGISNIGYGTVKNCSSYYNTGTGINVNAGSIAENNISKGNSSNGIYAGASSVVRGNTASGNVTHGISASGGCLVVENTTYENGTHGISAGEGTIVKNNTAYENGSSGIYISSSGCAIIGNTSRKNQNYGIYANDYNLVDQNSAYLNNQSGGGYANLLAFVNCTIGLNNAP